MNVKFYDNSIVPGVANMPSLFRVVPYWYELPEEIVNTTMTRDGSPSSRLPPPHFLSRPCSGLTYHTLMQFLVAYSSFYRSLDQ